MKRRIGQVELRDLAVFSGDLEVDGDYDSVELVNLDLTGQNAENSRFLGTRVAGCVLDDVALTQAQIADCILTEVRAHTLVAIDSAWRDVAVTDCRLGAVTAYGAHLTRVRFAGGKLDYLNLRDGALTDVVFEDCVIGELDLIGARLLRVTFTGCRVGQLDVTRATLDRVDLRGADYSALHGLANLRGATISSEQLTDLAPHLATHLGLTIQD
ncbi:MAG: pentapeptide repeat-containing protein [Cellulomonas sp.]